MRTDEEQQQRLSELQQQRQATVAEITGRQDATFDADVQKQYEQNQAGGQDLSATATPDDPSLRADAEGEVRERNEKEVADAVAPIDARIADAQSRSADDDGHNAAAPAASGDRTDDGSHDRDAGSGSSAPDNAAQDHSDTVSSPDDRSVASSQGSSEPEPEPEAEAPHEAAPESRHEEPSSESQAPEEERSHRSTQHSNYVTGPEQSPSALGHLKSVPSQDHQSQSGTWPGERPPGAQDSAPGKDAQQGSPQQPDKADRPASAGETSVPWSQQPATVTTGAQENPRFTAVYGPNAEKPYADNAEVRTATTDNDRFMSSRLYESGAKPGEVSHPDEDKGAQGRWSARQDATQYSPEQHQKMDALPQQPDTIADRRHPQGQTLSEGEAGQNKYGPGGGPQLEARDNREGETNTPRADWNKREQQWDLRLSGDFNRASNPKDFEHEKQPGERPASAEGPAPKVASVSEAASLKMAEKESAKPAPTPASPTPVGAGHDRPDTQPAQSPPQQSSSQQSPSQQSPSQQSPSQQSPSQQSPSQQSPSQQPPSQQPAPSPSPVGAGHDRPGSQPTQTPQVPAQSGQGQPGQSPPAQGQSPQGPSPQGPSGNIPPPSEPNFSAGSGAAPRVKPPSEPAMPAAQSGQPAAIKPPSEPNVSQPPPSQPAPQPTQPSQNHDR